MVGAADPVMAVDVAVADATEEEIVTLIYVYGVLSSLHLLKKSHIMGVASNHVPAATEGQM